jgi:7-cyano-7-deazaguanine synthase
MAERAIVLVSGGLDSATALAWALDQGWACTPISFQYGQRHEVELTAAAAICESMSCPPPRVIALDPAAFAASSLTGSGEVPRDRSDEEMADGIPSTYVPARNTIFLAYALGFAETLSACHIVIGVNAVDYSGYPDCRPEFIEAFRAMANLATKAGVEGTLPVSIETPLIAMTKAEIIQLGTRLGVNYGLTHSCYDPDAAGAACGRCDSCTIRRAGFAAAGVADPTRYSV